MKANEGLGLPIQNQHLCNLKHPILSTVMRPPLAAQSSDRESDTLQKPETRTGESDHDAVAHIVPKDEQMRGYVGGEAIKALCGKVWVPSRDYQGLPICQVCIKERDRRIAGLKRMN